MIKRFLILIPFLILGLIGSSQEQPPFVLVGDSIQEEAPPIEIPPFYVQCGEELKEERTKCTSDFLFAYVKENVIYPKIDRKAKVEGEVLAMFIVEKDGSVRRVEILRSVSETIDAEVVRVLKSLPNFTPATSDGKPMRFKYSIPVDFSLNKRKKKN